MYRARVSAAHAVGAPTPMEVDPVYQPVRLRTVPPMTDQSSLLPRHADQAQSLPAYAHPVYPPQAGPSQMQPPSAMRSEYRTMRLQQTGLAQALLAMPTIPTVGASPSLPPVRESRAAFLTRNGILRVLEAPLDGFDERFFMHSQDLLRGHDQAKVEAWLRLPPKTRVTIEIDRLGELRTQKQINRVRMLLTKTLRIITGQDNLTLVSPEPTGRTDAAGGFDYPTAWLAPDLPEEAEAVLREQTIWVTEFMTLYLTWDLEGPSHFVIAFAAFVNNDLTRIREAILGAFKEPRRLDFLAEVINNGRTTPLGSAPYKTAHDILDAMVVKTHVIPGDGRYVARVFCRPPTQNHDLWNAWQRSLQDIVLNPPLDCRVVARGPTRCDGCHAGDHLFDERFPRQLPDWIGELKLYDTAAMMGQGYTLAPAGSTPIVPARMAPMYNQWQVIPPQPADHRAQQGQPVHQPQYAQLRDSGGFLDEEDGPRETGSLYPPPPPPPSNRSLQPPPYQGHSQFRQDANTRAGPSSGGPFNNNARQTQRYPLHPQPQQQPRCEPDRAHDNGQQRGNQHRQNNRRAARSQGLGGDNY